MRLNGKNGSFLSLMEDFQAPVYTLCALLLGDGPAAEQVAQDCFTQAHTLFDDRNLTLNAQIWFLRIAYQQCLSLGPRSTGQIHQSCVKDSQISSCKTTPIQTLLAKLGPEDRVVISLRYSYRLELPEIAYVMGTDGEIVKSRLRQAKKSLVALYCQEALRFPEY